MKKFAETSGRSVEEAVAAGLHELGAEPGDVDIEVLDEGNKGLLGFIGGKSAKVRVTLRQYETEVVSGDTADRTIGFLAEMFRKMNVDVGIEFELDEESLRVTIIGDDTGILIGRRGETLDAIQYLASLIYNKGSDEYTRVVIDTANYRQKREEILVKLAHRIAAKVQKYKKSVTLEPMNPYERRIIHSTLQDVRDIKTYSIGDEPNRKVVIACK